jgi:hypothetical protein
MAVSDFPNGLRFSLEAAVPGGAGEVRLVHEVAPDGVRASAVAECVGGAAVTCTFELPATRQNVIIPGAEITYFWRITTSGGETVESDPQVITYEDTRFQWSTIDDGQITVWYTEDPDDARAVLAAARESLDRVGTLLDTTVDFPVKVFYYPSASDMQLAILSDNAAGVITLGEVVYSDTAMVAADAQPLDIARHEVAHIVVRQAVPEPYSVPDWLNEGTAVYAQDQPLRNQQDALARAIERDELFSVRSISSASAGSQGDTVSLFYGQSWSLVRFLVETYGDAQFAALFRAYAGGATTAEALQQVYGFDQDGLETAWRASLGLPPRVAPTPRDGATATPAPQPNQTPDDDGVPVVLIVVIAGLTVVLAGGLVAGGIAVSRRFG